MFANYSVAASQFLTTHGGALLAQSLPAAVMPYLTPSPTQHSLLPPGRLAQPAPPHSPQPSGQQTLLPPTLFLNLVATLPSSPALHAPAALDGWPAGVHLQNDSGQN